MRKKIKAKKNLKIKIARLEMAFLYNYGFSQK